MIKQFEKEDDPLSAAIDYWLNGNTAIPISWKSIVDVLKSTSVEEVALAEKMNTRHCQQELSIEVKKG